jgi:phosphopantothenoylcysteine synthetase/decarboxylase
MTADLPVLYVIICGSPAAAESPTFVRQARERGWRVCAVTTPTGARFVDTSRLRDLTGYPVRVTYKEPADPDFLPPADAYVVAPATFNTVNKIANGITDTLAVGLVCEGMGNGLPVIVAPWLNRPLTQHGAYRRSLHLLGQYGADLVMTVDTEPDAPPSDEQGHFPWAEVLGRVAAVQPRSKESELKPGTCPEPCAADHG